MREAETQSDASYFWIKPAGCLEVGGHRAPQPEKFVAENFDEICCVPSPRF